MKTNESKWFAEFEEFFQIEPVKVPDDLAKTITSRIQAKLRTSDWLVFAKVFAIQSVVGTFSLGICNQFGMSPFSFNISLVDYFMKFGHNACMVFCGFFFLGAGLLAARAFLTTSEVQVLLDNRKLQILGLASIFLGVFAILGAQLTLSLAALWLAGAILAGIVATIRIIDSSSKRI